MLFLQATRDALADTELVTALVKRLGEVHEFGRFLAVIGPSGSGKTVCVTDPSN